MRLTLLTQYYPPETGAPQNRLHDLAVRLAQRGHEVEVLTALPNYPAAQIHPAYRGRANTVEVIDGVRVARVGLYVPSRKSLVRQLLCYFSFAASARWKGGRLLSKSDVLLMESPPLFVCLAAVPLAKQLGARLVANISDLWPQAIVDLGKLRPGPALWAARRLEAWMYRRAALVTAQTEAIVADISRRFSSVRTELFPNGVDLERYEKLPDRDLLRRELGWGDDLFVVGYTGILGHSQALEQVVEAARMVQATGRDEILVALFGEGPKKEELERLIVGSGCTKVRIYPHQPGERMPGLQSAFDAGLVPLARGPVFEGARPSKMFEYMAAGIPLVVCARGEAAQIVQGPGGGCGVVVPPEEPEQLASAILELAGDRERARELGRFGREAVRKNFNRATIAQDLELLLTGLVTEDGDGRRDS